MKIGISGSHCSGKSELARALAYKYPTPIITGIADKYTKTQRTSLETQHDILKALIKAEKAQINFISDRTVIDALAYFVNRYKVSEKNHLTAAIYGRHITTFIGYIQNNPYDLIVYVDDVLPHEDNGIRDEEDNQIDIWSDIDSLLPFYSGLFELPYVVVKGPTILRVKKIDNIIKDLYSQKRVEDF